MTRDAKAEGPMTDAELTELLWRGYELSLGNPYQGQGPDGITRWVRETTEVHAALRPHLEARRSAAASLATDTTR
jgi:hypothetical protein